MKHPTVSTVWAAVITATLVVLAILITRRAFSQEGSQVLDRSFPYDIERSEEPLPAMFELLQDTGLSGGIVLMTDCGNSAPSQLRWTAHKGSTFRQVLDDFHTETPTYRWEMRGDALNLVPTAGVPPLLSVTVNFDLRTTDQQTNAGAALAMLQELPEVQRAAAALHLSEGMYTGGPEAVRDSTLGTPPPNKVPSPINVRVNNASLQDALNAVAQAYGHTMWTYEQRTCGGHVTYKIDESQTR
jgi:hypothetical protein